MEPEKISSYQTAELLLTMRSLARRGADCEAAELAERSEGLVKSDPVIALELARARMRQGDLIRARSALSQSDLTRASNGQRLILAMERASLLILEGSALRTARKAAGDALEAASSEAIEIVDRADAERVHARIELSAALFFDAAPDTAAKVVAGLPKIADVLETGGRLTESMAARLIYAERQSDLESSLAALGDIVERAQALGMPECAAEALLRQGDRLVQENGTTERIRPLLTQAARYYETAKHLHGRVDVRYAEARLAVNREFASTDAMLTFYDEYLNVQHPRGAMVVLMDLSQMEHMRGNMPAADRYRRRAIELAEMYGMKMTRDVFRLGQADLLMRSNHYTEAIDLCQSALGEDLPAHHVAAYQQLLATAYSFVGNSREALRYGKLAVAGFDAIGAVDRASLVVSKVANDLASLRRDDASDEAEALLIQWIARDEEAKNLDGLIRKHELAAQNYINQFNFSPARSRQQTLLTKGEALLAAAESLVDLLPPHEAAQRKGGLAQMRGQLLQSGGDSDGSEAAWREALRVYESAGLGMETANSHYMIGIMRLNRANQQLMPHFGESEQHLLAALDFYATTGMRNQNADTRYMLAQLYVNAALRVSSPLQEQLYAAALDHLGQAEAQYDAIRREYSAASVLEAQRGKRDLIKKSRRIYELALKIITSHGKDPQIAWDWTQRAKGRTLSDTLGSGAKSPAAVLRELEHDPEAFASVVHERDLARRLSQARPEGRLLLEQELADWHAHMRQDARLEKYLSLRSGTPITAVELRGVLDAESSQGKKFVCVDWFSIDERLWLIAFYLEGSPRMVELSLTLAAVRDFVTGSLGQQNYRATLLRNPEFLRAIDGLVEPLATLTEPGDYLILCPTGPLHAVPLHALHIQGEPLLVRNAVAYCPSLNVLRYSVLQSEPKRLTGATLFGDPSGDRPAASALVNEVASWFGTESVRGDAVTLERFREALSHSALVHFQGHAAYDRNDPLDSKLIFAGEESLEARAAFDLADVRVDVLTLAACESAATLVETGDEPMGLIPAFLYTGVNTVVATLWRVRQDSAAETMRRFYRELLRVDAKFSKIDALRTAALAVRATPGFETEYHWAPFVLNGDWR